MVMESVCNEWLHDSTQVYAKSIVLSFLCVVQSCGKLLFTIAARASEAAVRRIEAWWQQSCCADAGGNTAQKCPLLKGSLATGPVSKSMAAVPTRRQTAC